jgi:nucleolin
MAPKSKRAPKSDSESSSDSDSSSSEEEVQKKVVPKGKAAAAAPAKKVAKKQSSSESDSDSDSDSSSSSSSSEEEAPKATAGKKHGRDEETEQDNKRPKEDGIPVFLGFDKEMDEAAIRKFLNGYEVTDITFPATAVIARFGSFDNARAVANLNGTTTDGFKIDATLFPRAQREFPNTFDNGTPRTPREATSNSGSATVFVGNLPFDGADEESLGNHFSQAGEVVSVRLATDRETGKFRGFGHVTFASNDGAVKAVETLNGADFGGRELRVDHESGERRTPGSGGFGGRGGFGDRGGRGGRGGFGDRGGRGGFGDRGRGRGAPRGRGGPRIDVFGGGSGKKINFDE